MALIAHTYGWSPEEMRQLTDAEVDYYHSHVPIFAARAAYPVAALHADFREMTMPRYLDPDPDEPEKPEKPPRRRKLWTPEELLPRYAYFERPDVIPLPAAYALFLWYDKLPEWAQAAAPLAEAREAIEGAE